MKFLVFFLLLPVTILSQTIRINEFSNGPSGSKEWIEILVTPTSPTIPSLKTCFYNSVNIAGWVIDDNNGDFSPFGQYNGTGIADGHLRFKNVAPWTKLPVGALIVIYNSFDKDPLIPPDDRYDFNDLINSKKYISLDGIRGMGKNYDTPYIRFDEVYHPDYGLISLETLNNI